VQSGALALCAVLCIPRRYVVRMQVVNQQFGAYPEQILIQDNISLKCTVSLVMIEIAEMMTQKRLLAAAQGERPLELAADCEHGARTLQRQLNWPRRVATGAPQR